MLKENTETKITLKRSLTKLLLLMIKPAILLLLFFSVFGSLSSQTPVKDSINQLNSHGKKQGVWVEYLTKTLRVTKKKNAVFYRYTFYDNGKKADKIGYLATGGKSEFIGNKPGPKGEPSILNGTYKFYYPNGQQQMELSFNKGFRSGKAFF